MRLVSWLTVAAVTLGVVGVTAAVAEAHVAASVDDNNRYIRLELAGDRVRLAYTVFYGEVPGAGARMLIDANHDGQLDDAEAGAFAQRLADQVLDGIAVTVDGTATPIRWAQVEAGMGTPRTEGGAFSIDLVAWVCLPRARGLHTFTMTDRVKLPRPGETEVFVVEGKDILIDHARIGATTDPGNDFRFVGAETPFAAPGLDLAFTAGPSSVIGGEPACEGAGKHPLPKALIVALAAALATIVTTVVLVRRRSPAS